MSVGADLSIPGNYIFEFTLSSVLDQNEQNDHIESIIEVYGVPTAMILNQELSFCLDEPQVLVLINPSGGMLSGPGIIDLNFNPSAAGVGSHTITYSYTDINGCNAFATKLFEVNAQPKPSILNTEISCCKNDSMILISVTPSGGILSGAGITGLYLDPMAAGVGTHSIFYEYTDVDGCFAITEKQFTVFENPYVNLGPDQLVDISATIELFPSSDGFIFLWQDGSTQDNLTIRASNLGIGLFDIWVTATNTDLCSTTDSILLTISLVDQINTENNLHNPLIYPNPFRDYFNLEIDEEETLQSISIYGYNGLLYLNTIPNSYPNFYVPYMPPGFYVLKLKTDKHNYFQKIIKF
jgi:hypothetical protein